MIFLAIEWLNFCRLSVCSCRSRNSYSIRAYLHTFLGKSFPVNFEELTLIVIALRLRLVFFLVYKDFTPQRVLSNLYLLNWLEKRFSWHLLFTLLFSSPNYSRSFFCNFLDDSFKSLNEVCPVLLSNGASYFIPTRVVR